MSILYLQPTTISLATLIQRTLHDRNHINRICFVEPICWLELLELAICSLGFKRFITRVDCVRCVHPCRDGVAIIFTEIQRAS